MKKIFSFGLFALAFFSFGLITRAEVVITEVMYDVSSEIGGDADREWIEIYNNGSEEADLTGWKFNDGSNHNLNIPPLGGGQGSIIIPAGSYAVISGSASTFLSLFPGFSGSVIDTVMSLKNDEDTLKILKSDGSIASEFSYTSEMGASGDGKSLQRKSNGEWKADIPTAGRSANEDISVSSNEIAQIGGAGGEPVISKASPKNSSKPKEEEPQKLVTEIVSKSIIPVGLESRFETKTTGFAKESLRYGKWIWNMGDGMTFEKTSPEPFYYTYEYPGEYVLTLEYYPNFYSDTPSATDEVLVKAFVMDITFSVIENSDNKFVAIKNNTSYEVNIGKFIVKGSNGKLFVIPQGTKIFPNKTLVIPPKVSGFAPEDFLKIELLLPNGNLLKSFPVETKEEVTPRILYRSSGIENKNTNSDFQVLSESDMKESEDGTLIKDNLSASVIDSKSRLGFLDNKSAIIAMFVALIGFSAFLFIKTKPLAPQFSKTENSQNLSADDFNLIDE